MLINIQDDLIRLHAAGLLTRLLADKTTGRNIMWATDAYAANGSHYERNEPIMPELITGANTGIIKTRARKAFEQQTERTRRRAEVFTPLWICRKMTDHYYNECMTDSDTKKLIDSRQLEITCGEAPFLVSRYDTTTGEIIPIAERIGLLDRKLRIVGENAKDEKEWLKLSKRAFESMYGYEFQGDNLLIARVNLIETFAEYMRDSWRREPTAAEMRPIINIITWNVWQMDGLSGKIPYKTADEDNVQLSFFEEENTAPTQPPCMIYDWRARRPLEYNTMGKGNKTMKFDFVIGNPPYQEDNDNNNRQKPIYNLFMEESYKVAKTVELITPARFLFDAGQTPKAWNKKMLDDSHLKVIMYEQNGSLIFPNTDIKGGVAITLRDSDREFGKIGVFTTSDNLNGIIKKVSEKEKSRSNISNIAYPKSNYGFTEIMYQENPELKHCLTEGNEYIIDANIFKKMPLLFITGKPNDDNNYIGVYGREDNNRICKWIKRKYIKKSKGLDKYKIFVPGANGAGKFGEVLSNPFVAEPFYIHTQTYMSIGCFDTKTEADNCLKYIMTKFARTMLGVLKVTQNNPRDTWAKIPLQDFTPNSDIDWSRSIPEIDKQLYAKYGLSDDEITFIETHVKEMS